MPQHKTRKQLRLEASSVAAELAELKTPEGAARFLFAKRDDEEFANAYDAEISKFEEAQHAAEIEATNESQDPSDKTQGESA